MQPTPDRQLTPFELSKAKEQREGRTSLQPLRKANRAERRRAKAMKRKAA